MGQERPNRIDHRFRNILTGLLRFPEYIPESEIQYLKTLQQKDTLNNRDCSFIRSIAQKVVKNRGKLGGNYLKSDKEIRKFRSKLTRKLLKKIEEKHKREFNHYKTNIARWGSYKNYLMSIEWQTKRKSVIWWAKGICEQCKHNKATQVHHKHYKLLWAHEPREALMAVCRPCHEKIHGLR